MEDSDSKYNDSQDFAHNEETRLLKELQALMSCSVPPDLILSILQSQMLSHSNHDIHQSISHLLISYSGKRGTIANTTILPLDIAQIIRYLFGVSIAIINCTPHTTLKDLVTKLPVHSKVNYKEWTKQLKNKMIINNNKNKTKDNNNDDNDDDKDGKISSPKQETKDNDDNEIASQILILSDNINQRNTINIVHPQRDIERDDESHSSLLTDQYIPYHNRRLDNEKPTLKRYLSEPSLRTHTSSPSATPPPPYDEKDAKENKENICSPPFGYGIHEEHAITTKYHNHHYNRNRDHLSQSIHTLHNKLQHSSNNNVIERDTTHMNTSIANASSNGNTSNKASTKHKMEVIACQVILFHNIHKLSKAMQSIVIQIMKMKSVPTPEHGTHVKSSPSHQLCVCTRQYNTFIPYLLRDLCLIEYVIPSKKCLKKLHKFIKYDSNEHKQSYYSHISGISFDGSNDNKLTMQDNHYNIVQSQSPTMQQSIGGGATTSMKLKDMINAPLNEINTGHYGLFSPSKLRGLHYLVNKVFIHNSIAQYIRDIIIAIRLHPDVKHGCSSFRANEALKISSKFTNFIWRLSDRYKRLRNSNNKVDQLIARVHFVRPKDVDMMAIQILSHRIDIIANEYSPSPSLYDNMNNVALKNNRNRFLNKMAFSQIANINRSKDDGDGDEESSDDEKHNTVRRDFHQAKAEILKQLRVNATGVRRRGGGYRTGSKSVPRTPRIRRSLSHSGLGSGQPLVYQRSLENMINKRHKRDGRRRSRTIGNKQERERTKNHDIDIEDFEFELFSDSDDYDYIDDDEYENMDPDDDEEYGDDGAPEYDDINDEYVEEYDDYIEEEYEHTNINQNSKRNSNRQHDNDPQYSPLNETNEKKLSVEQRLVYNLLRRVLIAPK